MPIARKELVTHEDIYRKLEEMAQAIHNLEAQIHALSQLNNADTNPQESQGNHKS